MSAITSAILDCAEGWDPGYELPFVCGACLTNHHPCFRWSEQCFVFGVITCAEALYGKPGDLLPEPEREKLRDFAHREVMLGSVCQ